MRRDGGFSELRLGPVEKIRVNVALDPLATVFSLVADVYGGRTQGVPMPWRRRIRAAADLSADAVMAPVFPPLTWVVPDCVGPAPTTDDHDVAGHLERIQQLSSGQLFDGLVATFGDRIPVSWQPVVDSPQAWLRSYTSLLSHVWTAFEPTWRDATALLDREVERVGTAAVRGGLDVVMAGLSSRALFADDKLFLPDKQPTRFDLADRSLTLVPLVSGTKASMFALDNPDVAWIGYPLPSLGRLLEAAAPNAPRDDALTLVVGTQRARILRIVSTRATMAEIASAVGCSAATATYHCQQLAAAGLISRERHGNYVTIRRTTRGDELTHLLA